MLDVYGWSETLQRQFAFHAAEGLTPGRVIVQQRGLYRLVTPQGEVAAELSGRFLHQAQEGDHPVAGDWVAARLRAGERAATVHHVLPRASVFTRRASGPGGGLQVVAANVDLVLLVASLNADLSLRRLERYLATAWESGAKPAVVLTKADACEDAAALTAEVEAIAFGVPVLPVSALSGEGMEKVAALLEPGRTAVLLGSSGVGKSTLVNALAGEELMATGGVREDDARGRHTTTHRELVRLPGGALILDTPGMRELGLWQAEEGLSATFEDIEALAAGCRFRDCSHQGEPGCAVRVALEAGDLDEGRWKSFGKLQRELAHLDRRDDPQARAEYRKLWIQRNKDVKRRMKHRDREAY